MTEEQGRQKFRPRHVDESGHLTREENLRPRPSDYGLMSEKLETAAFTGAVEIVPLAHQLLRDESDGADATLDFGIGNLLAEHRGERLSAILTRAEALMTSAQWRPALLVLQEARRVDPGAAQPAALQVRCLMECGLHDAALRMLNYLRDRVTDPDVRLSLLRQEAACVRETTRAVEARIIILVHEQKLDEAVQLIIENLTAQPSNVVFLHHLAKLHYLRGDAAAARAAVREARRHIGRENLDLIAELERLLDFGTHERAIEDARQALRKGAATQAVRTLDAVAADLAGNEHYDGLREYAHARAAGDTGRPATADRVRAALAQQTLRWVLAEELRDAGDALRRGAFARTITSCECAAAIDARCGAVCYLHAQALHSAHATPKPLRPVESAPHDLSLAIELATRARIDAGYEDNANALLEAIAATKRGTRLRTQ